MTPSRRYVIITPCRNEAGYARVAIESVLAQTVLPDLWIIVDDGSTDETPEILSEYEDQHAWIKVMRRPDRGRRAVGPGVVDAFYSGLEQVPDLNDFEYICKLDLDLQLPPRYFEILMERMEADPRLGTCSGKPYFMRSCADPTRNGKAGKLVSERIGDETSAGMTKFYRIACFQQIGGFVREVMWDGIDCHRCRMLGWTVRSWDEPELRFIHMRPMGSSQQSIWTGRARHGFGQWFMGTGLTYVTASAVLRMSTPPLVFGGLALWWGYISSMLRGEPRYEDRAFRRFLRSFHRLSLLVGKRRAMHIIERRTAHRWVGDHRSTMHISDQGRRRDRGSTKCPQQVSSPNR